MKKSLLLFSAIILALTLVGCASLDGSDAAKSVVETTSKNGNTVSVKDPGFGQFLPVKAEYNYNPEDPANGTFTLNYQETAKLSTYHDVVMELDFYVENAKVYSLQKNWVPKTVYGLFGDRKGFDFWRVSSYEEVEGLYNVISSALAVDQALIVEPAFYTSHMEPQTYTVAASSAFMAFFERVQEIRNGN